MQKRFGLTLFAGLAIIVAACGPGASSAAPSAPASVAPSVAPSEEASAPASVEQMDRRAAGGSWLRIEITEGRNRQLRRMGEAVGHRVMRLHRVRYAGIGLQGLAPGRWRPITRTEWTRLAASVGLER